MHAASDADHPNFGAHLIRALQLAGTNSFVCMHTNGAAFLQRFGVEHSLQLALGRRCLPLVRNVKGGMNFRC